MLDRNVDHPCKHFHETLLGIVKVCSSKTGQSLNIYTLLGDHTHPLPWHRRTLETRYFSRFYFLSDWLYLAR